MTPRHTDYSCGCEKPKRPDVGREQVPYGVTTMASCVYVSDIGGQPGKEAASLDNKHNVTAGQLSISGNMCLLAVHAQNLGHPGREERQLRCKVRSLLCYVRIGQFSGDPVEDMGASRQLVAPLHGMCALKANKSYRQAAHPGKLDVHTSSCFPSHQEQRRPRMPCRTSAGRLPYAVEDSTLLWLRLDLTSGGIISKVRGRGWNGARTAGEIDVLRACRSASVTTYSAQPDPDRSVLCSMGHGYGRLAVRSQMLAGSGLQVGPTLPRSAPGFAKCSVQCTVPACSLTPFAHQVCAPNTPVPPAGWVDRCHGMRSLIAPTADTGKDSIRSTHLARLAYCPTGRESRG